MARKQHKEALHYFDEHLREIADNLYEGDDLKAFRHTAFQILAPDRRLSDEAVIEWTAIDQSGDLEIDGWFPDEESGTLFLFQSVGGKNKVDMSKVTKFWEAPIELLNPQAVANSNNASVRELSGELDAKLAEEYNLSMIFVAKNGFVPSARIFADARREGERQLKSLSGDTLSCRCSFQLLDQTHVANTFYDLRSGYNTTQTNVELQLNGDWTYEVNQSGPRSIRATVPATELVRVFKKDKFKLFALNPRGPLATAKVNKNIRKTLETPEGRSRFHLLNNGMCATCNDFRLNRQNGSLAIKGFQIVNGCQTTYTLSDRSKEELEETHVDLKLVVADKAMAEEIAQASNSQTALRAMDYTSFERQQIVLQGDFERLQFPWYYEIKQGYWSNALEDKEKARFKTGTRKRHIVVKDLAQASLAFLGEPSVAMDRIRYVFQGIRSTEDRKWYEMAFPKNVRARQLILPWKILAGLRKETLSTAYSRFHILWLIGEMLRKHYKNAGSQYFSSELSSRLSDTIESWLPDRYRIADIACRIGIRRARRISGEDGEDLEVRHFFRGGGDYGGQNANGLLWEACQDELEDKLTRNSNFSSQLPN